LKIYKVEEENVRLDRFLRRVLSKNLPQSLIEASLKRGLILLDGKKAKSSTRCKLDQKISVNFVFDEVKSHNKKDQININLLNLIKKSVIYEDQNIVAINKPFGIPVQSGKGVKESIDILMKEIYKDIRVVHRLDKHTTGVLIFAKNLKATTEIWQIFKEREVKKSYLAIVVGKMRKDYGKIENFIQKSVISGEEIMTCNQDSGDLAITEFKVLKKSEKATLVLLKPRTGRKHQLRAHMVSIGHPIVGDGKYGKRSAFLKGLNKKMNLHASSLEFSLFDKSIKISAKEPNHMSCNFANLSFI